MESETDRVCGIILNPATCFCAMIIIVVIAFIVDVFI